jgi:hypothetical protein
VLEEEAKFDFSLLEKAIVNKKVEWIDKIVPLTLSEEEG